MKRGESANAKLALVLCSLFRVLKPAQTLCRSKLNIHYRVSMNIEQNCRLRETLVLNACKNRRTK